MPIHDLGYRPWSGQAGGSWARFTVISRAGIQVVLRNKWVRRVLLAAWLPTLFFAVLFFAYEQYLKSAESDSRQRIASQFVISEMTEETPDFEFVQEGLLSPDPARGRHLIWSWLLSTFLRLPQAVMTMLIVGMIAPPLIAKDIRTRAFLLYFSRPISRGEYVLGKFFVVAAFLAFITMVPALGCYVFGVALSSDPGAFFDTWDLPLRIVLAASIFIVPAVSVSLMFSSLTSESRFAAFAWFATWGLGAVAWQVLSVSMINGQTQSIYRDFRERQNVILERRAQERAEMWKPITADQGRWEQLGRGLQQELLTQATELSDRIPGNFYVDEVTGDVRFDWGDQKDAWNRPIVFREGQLEFVYAEDRELERKRQAAIIEAQREVRRHPLSLISMYDTLVRLQRFVFGLETHLLHVLPGFAVMLVVTLGSWLILLSRVSAPLRV